MAADPPWKRVLGGVIGVVIAGCVLWYARGKGVSAEQIGHWEQLIVFAAAGGGIAVLILRRHRR